MMELNPVHPSVDRLRQRETLADFYHIPMTRATCVDELTSRETAEGLLAMAAKAEARNEMMQ